MTIHFREEGTPLTNAPLRVVVWPDVPRHNDPVRIGTTTYVVVERHWEVDANRVHVWLVEAT